MAWQASIDPEGNPVTYGVILDHSYTEGSVQWRKIQIFNTSLENSLDLGSLRSDTTYHWTVVAHDTVSHSESASETWSFTTANDSCPSDPDIDKDGLPDEWERNGLYSDGEFIDLPSLGAKVGQKDLFIWIDHMYKPGIIIGKTMVGAVDCSPSKAVIDAVIEAFKRREMYTSMLAMLPIIIK